MSLKISEIEVFNYINFVSSGTHDCIFENYWHVWYSFLGMFSDVPDVALLYSVFICMLVIYVS